MAVRGLRPGYRSRTLNRPAGNLRLYLGVSTPKTPQTAFRRLPRAGLAALHPLFTFDLTHSKDYCNNCKKKSADFADFLKLILTEAKDS